MEQDLDFSPYKVELDMFSGPMDLLLYLVRREEVEIYELPLARVIDQYLEYMDIVEQLDLSVAGDFLIMAATLMELKSRMLLPVEDQGGEDDEDDDPHSELIYRLLEYKRFKDASRFLQGKGSTRQKMATRPREVVKIPKQWMEEELLQKDPLEGVTLWDLLGAYSKVIKRFRPVDQARITNEEIPIREFFHQVIARLHEKSPRPFEELLDDRNDRGQIIGTFLAILELVRLKKISVVQAETFGQIWLEWVEGASVSEQEMAAALEFMEGAKGDSEEEMGDEPAITEARPPEEHANIETLRSKHQEAAQAEELEESLTPLPGFEARQVDYAAEEDARNIERIGADEIEIDQDGEEFDEADEIEHALASVRIPDIDGLINGDRQQDAPEDAESAATSPPARVLAPGKSN